MHPQIAIAAARRELEVAKAEREYEASLREAHEVNKDDSSAENYSGYADDMLDADADADAEHEGWGDGYD